MKIRVLAGIVLLLLSFFAYADERSQDLKQRLGKCFIYTAKRFGVTILQASIKIDNESLEHGKPLYQVRANVESLDCLGFLFRMNNRFTSTIEGEPWTPVRYVKEIDQKGLLIKNKNYIQTVTFDNTRQRMVVEKQGEDGKQEIPLPPETYDPLSMFARYYLRDEFRAGRDIQISLFDGMKLRQMVFHARNERVNSKIYGEVEAICLESTTPFSTFGDKEGIIRIWYLNNKEKIPILMELELPIGNVEFELEEIRES